MSSAVWPTDVALRAPTKLLTPPERRKSWPTCLKHYMVVEQNVALWISGIGPKLRILTAKHQTQDNIHQLTLV